MLGAKVMALRAFFAFMANLFSEDEIPSAPGFALIDFSRDNHHGWQRSNGAREALEGEETCCICFVNFPDSGFSGCHATDFCSACVEEVLQRGLNCPLCRRAVVESQPLELELQELERFQSEQFERGGVPVQVNQPPVEEQPEFSSRRHGNSEESIRRFNEVLAAFGERIQSDLRVSSDS